MSSHRETAAVIEHVVLSAKRPVVRAPANDRGLATFSLCRSSKSLSDAGRKLFAVSRAKKQNPNDADRLRKYLARFGLSWDDVRGP